MAGKNKSPIKLKTEDKVDIVNAVTTLTEKLQPYLVALSPTERNDLPRLNEHTIGFVDEALKYAKDHPEFIPLYPDIAKLSTDINTVAALKSISNVLEQTITYLNDTVLFAGSEAYVAALTYYNSVKYAAQSGDTKAKTIHEDLSKKIKSGKKKN